MVALNPRRTAARLAAVAAVTLLGLPGCRRQASAPAPAPRPRHTVGVALMNRQHEFYRVLESALQAAAARHGVAVSIHDANFRQDVQAAQVEDLIASRVNALIITPVDSKGVVPSVEAANRAGIPVITADIASAGGKVICHVASDNVMGGRLAGEFMARALGGKGEIAIIDYPVVTSVLDRTHGFREAIRKWPGIRIVKAVDGKAVRDKAMDATEAVLTAHPNLRGIFGINDDSVLGALTAVEAANRQRQIILVGYDATREAREAIQRGSALKADVMQHPDRIGATAMEMAVRAIRGEAVPKVVPIAVSLYTGEKR